MVGIRALVGSTRRVVVLGVVLLLLVGGGAVAAGAFGTPSVTGVDNRFGPVDAETTVIESNLHVSNPNPLGLDLGDVTVDYEVSMNGVGMANGTKDGVVLRKGTTTLPFRTEMRNERIPDWWVTHVKNDERTTLSVDASVSSSLLGGSGVDAPEVSREIETDLIGGFASNETRPVNANQPLVSDPVLYVNETDAAWGEVNDSTTPIEMDFTLYNPKATPVALTEIGYTVTMNDVTVGEGVSDRSYVIGSKQTRTLQTETSIDNARLDDWWVSHLGRNQTTDLRIEFYAKFRVAGNTVQVPLDSLTYTKTFETDMFDTKADGNASVGGGTSAGGSDGGSGGEGSTATATGSAGGTTDGEATASTTTTTTTTTTKPGTTATREMTTEGGDGSGTTGSPTTTDDGGLVEV